MAEHEEPEKIWDEYDWERFLQQQDRKTERYMELFEKYIDDPERDRIIAREMGWNHLFDGDDRDWTEEAAPCFSEEMDMLEEELAAGREEEGGDGFEMHPLYQAAFALTIWLDQLFDELGDLQNHPAAVKLATQSAVASAKLAAALSEDDTDELGMNIAYLKRALKAVTNALDAAEHLKKEVRLAPERHAALRQRLFQIRDHIIILMGELRLEWRRRHG
jgi:hypothetical protein